MGAGEAPIFPGNASVVRRWFPLHERGKATALFDVGSYVGSALAAPFVIWIILAMGWRTAFLIFSGIGILWSIAWFLYYREPAEHFSISKKELAYIEPSLAKINDVPSSTSLREKLSLLKNKQIWGMSIGFFCYNYLKNFFLTWFPSYLVAERGFTLMKVGMVAMIPPLCAIIGELLIGHLTDSLIRRNVSLSFARKIPLCAGMLLSSVIVGAAFVESSFIAMLLFTISYTALISASTGIWAIPGDIAKSKNEVGTIGGIQNTFSNIAGIVAPIITGWLFGITGSFMLPLLISGTLAIIGAVSYWFIVGELRQRS